MGTASEYRGFMKRGFALCACVHVCVCVFRSKQGKIVYLELSNTFPSLDITCISNANQYVDPDCL